MGEQEKKKAELKITGMHCATCAITIEESLSKIRDVSQAHVNLGTESARVEFDPAKVKLSDLEKAVKEAGYDVIDRQATIRVGGMVCATCVETIETTLRALPGVAAATVNLGTEKAYVTYNESITTLLDMKKAIEDTGYQYLGLAEELADEQEKKIRAKDLHDKFLRFTIGFAVSLLLMIAMWIPLPVSMHTLAYVMLIIATPVFIYVSYPIFRAAGIALSHRMLNMDVMYAMGIGVSYIASVMGTFSIVLTHEFMLYDTAIMLASFLMLGRYLEAQAKGRTSDAIRNLIGLKPKTAIIIRDGKESEIPVDDVSVGDIVIIKPGGKVPVDGEVVSGEGYVDEAMITGEPVPSLKAKGNRVVAGTISQNGVLSVKATKVGKETVLSQIIRLVEEAQGSKPPVQRIADVAVTYFIPAVLAIAIVSFLLWYFILDSTLLFALTALISVLVVACPCALGLATPTAVTVGVGRGAELGILIRNGEALEISEKVTAVAVDKTGTLTQGKPEVTDVVPYGIMEETLVALAAAVEKNSAHPLAQAIVKHAEGRGIQREPSDHFTTYSGQGVFATVLNEPVLVGNRVFFREKLITVPDDADARITLLEDNGKTVVLLAAGGRFAGMIAIADPLKENSKSAISSLHSMGIEVVMVTGDNQRTANVIAQQAGITQVIAEVLPDRKAAEVKAIQEKGMTVAFIGDGINDAPALAQADVGIAIGSGTDVAIESGDIVLINNDLTDAVAAIQLSQKVMGRIRGNIFWAFAYNTALIPVGAGVLYPLSGIMFRPELAAAAMAASSVTVVTLSLLLKRYIPPVKLGRR